MIFINSVRFWKRAKIAPGGQKVKKNSVKTEKYHKKIKKSKYQVKVGDIFNILENFLQFAKFLFFKCVYSRCIQKISKVLEKIDYRQKKKKLILFLI